MLYYMAKESNEAHITIELRLLIEQPEIHTILDYMTRFNAIKWSLEYQRQAELLVLDSKWEADYWALLALKVEGYMEENKYGKQEEPKTSKKTDHFLLLHKKNTALQVSLLAQQDPFYPSDTQNLDLC